MEVPAVVNRFFFLTSNGAFTRESQQHYRHHNYTTRPVHYTTRPVHKGGDTIPRWGGCTCMVFQVLFQYCIYICIQLQIYYVLWVYIDYFTQIKISSINCFNLDHRWFFLQIDRYSLYCNLSILYILRGRMLDSDLFVTIFSTFHLFMDFNKN